MPNYIVHYQRFIIEGNNYAGCAQYMNFSKIMNEEKLLDLYTETWEKVRPVIIEGIERIEATTPIPIAQMVEKAKARVKDIAVERLNNEIADAEKKLQKLKEGRKQ